MNVTIDRFEGNFAIVELPDGKFANISKTLLPDAMEGDIISIEIEHEQTNKKTKENKERLHRLFNRSND